MSVLARPGTTRSTAAPSSGHGPQSPVAGGRPARFLLLFAVFLCAACGLVYELALTALGSYLIGNSVLQTSIVLSVMVFAMGVGSLAAKPLRRRAAGAFALVEGLLALVGGMSVLVLYVAFAWLRVYTPGVVVISFVVGMLIGAEIPLLMTLLQRIRRQEAGGAVADMFAVDYIGALVGGLLFPLFLLPTFGQIKGALMVGAVNALAGMLVVLWIFRRQIRRVVLTGLVAGMAGVLAVLGCAYALADGIQVTARQQLYKDPVIRSERTPYQQIVLTESPSLSGHGDMRLFLDGDLQFSSVDEYRYHESLVHPAMAGPHARVLILGGGDALAAREVLRYDDVRSVTLVELDEAMTRLAHAFGPLRKLNHDALADPRAHVVNEDAFNWLRDTARHFDTVVIDFPDPDTAALAKLYSVEFYTMVRHVLGPDGRVVVQSGSPYFAPNTFWSIEASMRRAGLTTTPYHMDVPSFGDWGFVLARSPSGAHPGPPELRVGPHAPELRFLDEEVLRAARVFPKDRRRRDVDFSTLMDPAVLEYCRHEWSRY
jgi:spermidine synthase